MVRYIVELEDDERISIEHEKKKYNTGTACIKRC